MMVEMRGEKRIVWERKQRRDRVLSSRIPSYMEIMLPNLGRNRWDNSSTNKTMVVALLPLKGEETT